MSCDGHFESSQETEDDEHYPSMQDLTNVLCL